MKKFEVYESTGDLLSLVVYGDSNLVEYIHTGYEFNPGQLTEDISRIRAGDDPATMWEGNEIEEYLKTINENPDDLGELFEGLFGELVADNDSMYFENMGAAAMNEFGVEMR